MVDTGSIHQIAISIMPNDRRPSSEENGVRGEDLTVSIEPPTLSWQEQTVTVVPSDILDIAQESIGDGDADHGRAISIDGVICDD